MTDDPRRAVAHSPEVHPLQATPELEEARRVLRCEAAALIHLADALDESFLKAVDLIAAAQGRCILTGMGKSGHVARKIAATLASTGTPAFFVHPAEANHGDLGMIQPTDVVIALSNSGETAELFPTLSYCARYQIPLIVFTSQAHSTLAQAAASAVILPALQEACPLGLAPMTSTTAMMALGDALSAALLTRNHFSSQNFGLFHPGGTLGKRLRTARDVMYQGEDMPLIQPEAPMEEALLQMTSKRFGCVGVVDAQGSLIGIVTDGDLRRHMRPDFLKLRVRQVMTPHPQTLSPCALLEEALFIMNTRQITSLFITPKDARTPLGIIHIHDCLRPA